MELGATMELRDGIGGQLGGEDTPYIVEEQIQPLSTNPACIAWYYHVRAAVLPQRHAVLPQGPAVISLRRAVLLPATEQQQIGKLLFAQTRGNGGCSKVLKERQC